MVRAEDPGATVSRMLVQAMNPALTNRAEPVSNQDVVEDQPRQRMVGVPPAGYRRRHPEGEASFFQ